jgi:hypothetical protein
MYFSSKDSTDFRLCRPCRDTIHFERVLESLANCPKCIEWVNEHQHTLKKYAQERGKNTMKEFSRALQDAAEGNDMYDAIAKDVENCMSFLFTRILPADDPEDNCQEAQPETILIGQENLKPTDQIADKP